MPYDDWQELQAYLGDIFDLAMVPGGEALMNAAIARKGEEHYLRKSTERLYCQTAFGLNTLREPFFQLIREVAQPCEVLDYGCGVGNDGLRLAAMGYRASFADEPGACLDYLKWRLRRRKIKARIYDLKAAPRMPLVITLPTPDRPPPPIERLAELGQIVALGIGPLDPSIAEAFTRTTLPEVRRKYELIKWASFNVNWYFVAFRTPEPEMDIEEATNG